MGKDIGRDINSITINFYAQNFDFEKRTNTHKRSKYFC